MKWLFIFSIILFSCQSKYFLVDKEPQQTYITDVVTWTSYPSHVKGNLYKLFIVAEIKEGWHVYSQELEEDTGPIPTSFNFEETSGYILQGQVKEQKPIFKYDANFEMELSYFEEKAVFVQEVKVIGDLPLIINGAVEFMVCNETMCYPPEEVSLSFTLLK